MSLGKIARNQAIERFELFVTKKTGRLYDGNYAIFDISQTAVPSPLFAGEGERQSVDSGDFGDTLYGVDQESDPELAQNQSKRRPTGGQLEVLATVDDVADAMAALDHMAYFVHFGIFKFDGSAGKTVGAANFLNRIRGNGEGLTRDQEQNDLLGPPEPRGSGSIAR
ncbi:MAG TPA: hypothetical protein VJR26_08860 [Candidatus Acidoferrales bacterium]|nr:hypothetical protein [Candidatus Acidoferrales bacterium]